MQTLPFEPRLANGRTGGRPERRGAPTAHCGKSAPLLAKNFSCVFAVQPSHTCGMSIAPLSSRLPTFPQNVDPSQLILQFSKRANGVRVSKVRLQSVIGLAFSMQLEPPAEGDEESLEARPLSHFGVSPCSLSRRLLVLKTGKLVGRGRTFVEKLANGLRVVRSTCRKCVRVAPRRRKLSF